MKAFLLYRNRDGDRQQPGPWYDPALIQDLELGTLLNAMALGDKHVFEVVRHTVLSGLTDLEMIRYRQDILRDCLNNAGVVRQMYTLAIEAIEGERKAHWGWGLFSKSPSAILHWATDALQMFTGMLRRLRSIADDHAGDFHSEGFTALFRTLQRELDDDYFARIQEHLRRLRFREGALVSAGLGKGNKGVGYVLRKPHEQRQTWMERLFGHKPPVYAVYIHPRDEAGARALSELRDQGVNPVANALAQSTDHILSFFTALQTQLAFYVGCLNLHERLAGKGEPTCFPEPAAGGEHKRSFQGLYDVCLSLSVDHRVVGNDADADHKGLVLITGANQGGKSTFLRSIGLAQLMMQCGMFVPAESFCASVCSGLFTHYKREEDPTMKSGKFDEELGRMSEIADHLRPGSLVLFNESFAATNEREGSEIARQITRALLEYGTTVFFVTHLYDFARSMYAKGMENALFLRAERQPDGRRTFRLIAGEPLETSYGKDLYEQIFCSAPEGPSRGSDGAGDIMRVDGADTPATK
jgi:DNA mismatch repair ATPase MutS